MVAYIDVEVGTLVCAEDKLDSAEKRLGDSKHMKITKRKAFLI